MFPRKYKKLSSFKRFVLKLLNVYALDRETLNLVNPNYKNYGNNTFIINIAVIISNVSIVFHDCVLSLLSFFNFCKAILAALPLGCVP